MPVPSCMPCPPRRRLWPAVLALTCLPGLAGADDGAGTDAGFIAGFGPAADWSLTSRITLSTAADLNRDLNPGDGGDLLLTNRLDTGLSLQARTKRGLYTADLGAVGIFYLGPDQPTQDQPIDPRFSTSARYSGKRYVLNSSFSFDIRPVTDTQFDDTGIVSTDTQQLSVNYSAGLTHEITKRDQLTVSTSAGVVDFLDGGAPGLVATRTASLGLGWGHTVDARTSLGLDLNLRHFTSQNPQNTRSQTLTLGGNFSQQRTRRHRIGLGAGFTFVRTSERGRGVDVDVSFNGSASFGYRLKDQTFDLSLSQGIEPSSAGTLQSFTRVGAGWSWTVTPRQSVSLGINYTHRTGVQGGSASDAAQANAGYSLALTRETRLGLDYRFRVRNDQTGFATGHQMMLTLSQDFTLLP